jgi:hypothetical protein
MHLCVLPNSRASIAARKLELKILMGNVQDHQHFRKSVKATASAQLQ